MPTDYILWRDILDTFQSMHPLLQLFFLIMTGFLIWASGRGFCRLLTHLFERRSPPAATSSPPPPLPEGQYWMVVDAQGGVRIESVDQPAQLTQDSDQRRLRKLGRLE